MHTHSLTHYAVRIGRKVVFMARPKATKQKQYREPVVVAVDRFNTVEEAEKAIKIWSR